MAKGKVKDETSNVVVDVVRNPGDKGDDQKVSGILFPGLFLNQLPDDCFSIDGNHIILSQQRKPPHYGCFGHVVRF